MLDRLRRLMPSHEGVANNRWLKWLGPSVLHPRLFHLSRRGVATGAAIGVVVAGPAGVVVGGALGAVAGALGGAAAGTTVNPEESSSAATVPADGVGHSACTDHDSQAYTCTYTYTYKYTYKYTHGVSGHQTIE
jgi:uncharacterized protein YcfJ